MAHMRLLSVGALACALASAPLVATAQTSTSSAAAAPTVTLQVQDIPARDVLRHIGRVGGIPLAIGANVDVRVDLVLDAVPPQAALQVVLDLAQLQGRMVGEVLVVEPRPAPPVEEAAKRPSPEAPKTAEESIDALLEAYAPPKDSLRKVLEGTDHTGTPPKPPREAKLSAKSAKTDQERPLPNYDGRAAEDASAGEILIWVPRVLFFPVHIVMNYVVRIPIVWTLTRMEEYSIFQRIERIITFRNGKSIIAPTFFADFGLRPAVGLTNSNDDLFFRGNNLTLSAAYGGSEFLSGSVINSSSVLSDESGTLRFFGSYVTRPDQPFYGQGPFTSTDDRFNYKIQQAEAGWDLRAVLQDLSWIRFGMRFRNVDIFNGGIRNDNDGNFNDLRELNGASRNVAFRTVEEFGTTRRVECGDEAFEYFDRGQPQLPCGYDDAAQRHPSYRVLESRLEAKFDTRDPDTEFEAGSGALFESFVTFEFDPSNVSRNWLRWGGEVAGFLDMSGVGHTLALRVYGEFTERTGAVDDPIPFTELPSLGGLENMRGFLPRRFVGDSAFMTELSYRYPIWSLIDAEVFAAVGNVFDGHYRNFAFDRLHLSTGLSLRTSFTRDSSLQLLIALGTSRFEETQHNQFEIDAVRFAFGYVQGF